MNMNVSLPDELAAYVKAKVATGCYESLSEVVREALRLMERMERSEGEVVRLRQAWDSGKASGTYGEIDFEALPTEARQRLSVAGEAGNRAD